MCTSRGTDPGLRMWSVDLAYQQGGRVHTLENEVPEEAATDVVERI